MNIDKQIRNAHKILSNINTLNPMERRKHRIKYNRIKKQLSSRIENKREINKIFKSLGFKRNIVISLER